MNAMDSLPNFLHTLKKPKILLRIQACGACYTHTSEEEPTHDAVQYCACWVYLMQHKMLDFTSAYLEEFLLNYT